MKKYLTSPLFAPVFFSLVWLLWMCCLFIFEYDRLPELLSEEGIIEIITNVAYLPLLLAYICLAKFFWSLGAAKRIDFVMYVSLGDEHYHLVDCHSLHDWSYRQVYRPFPLQLQTQHGLPAARTTKNKY